jgi:predicted transcriptional regulator
MKENIINIMSAKGFTITRLSAVSGIPYLTLYRRLNKPEKFRVCELWKLAKALDVNANLLLTNG